MCQPFINLGAPVAKKKKKKHMLNAPNVINVKFAEHIWDKVWCSGVMFKCFIYIVLIIPHVSILYRIGITIFMSAIKIIK